MKLKLKFKLDFFKRNPIMSSIIGPLLLISMILIYMIYDENSARLDSDLRLEELKEKISVLNSTSPYPSEKNIELITKDIRTLKLNTYKLEDVFGYVYAKPLLAFMKSLKKEDLEMLETKLDELEKEGSSATLQRQNDIKTRLEVLKSMTDEELVYDFINSWKVYIEEEKKTKQELSVGDIFNNFRKYKKYTPEEFDLARNAFLIEFQKMTLEPLNKDTIDDYILASLGISLDFSRIRCKNIASDIESGLNRILTTNNVAVQGGKLTLFTEFASVPSDDEIPYIINYCRFLEDFFQRVAKSNIESIESYNKMNGIKGFEDSNFLIFEYKIDVITSMESLRTFLDNLQEAYKENRVYVVEAFSVSVLEDNVNNLPPYNPKAQISNPASQIKILLGTSDIVKASIVVNYVIFKKKIL
ncbi:MAG: hypothetical protein WCR55_00305 [Lentisphaerota bacterium]